ncbi:MAG: hypothetical protein ABJA66_13950 [Actinomycetota bacterium]
MSVEILETIKEQAKALTAQEREILADYLVNNSPESGKTDLGLNGEGKEEKRRLRDIWMRSETNREKYGGLYAALDGDILVGTGKNYPEASLQAKKSEAVDFVIDFVLPLDYVGEIGSWE